ncbi:MAG: response regulator transcription factor [Burkholderiales bacterium]
MKKALLIDDHTFLREALALVMAREMTLLTVLQAGDLAHARELLRAHPDIGLVLLDLTLPDGHGLELLPELREATAARLVVMSADDSEHTILAAIQAGAAGYIPKTLDSAGMLEALHLVMAGSVYLPPRWLAGTQGVHAASPRTRDVADLGLSPRQGEVLRLLIEGRPNKSISRELEMSESTVKTHLAAIFRKLDANSRTQAVVAAARLGLRLVP